jgi:C-terminal processing protease CtpA/Prc
LFEEQHRGQTLQSVSTEGQALTVQRPLVTLVGPGSFSGGEILPAVLRSRGRAVTVGEQTGGGFGSSVTVSLSDGSALNVTTTEVVIGPDKQRLNKTGLTPDIVVARTPEDIEAGRDPQLDAALHLLDEQLRR